MIGRSAQQHEDLSLRHLELALNHWMSLAPHVRQETWQLEITRAFAREIEKRKSLDDQLARVQQEANQLRAQVERLGSCQWPREFALFPPDTLPLPRDVARELDAKESQISPGSAHWDYENVVTKWKRVVNHDKSMGRVGVGYGNPAHDDHNPAEKPRAGEEQPANQPKSRSLQPPTAMSPPGPSPSQTVGTSASPNQHPSPYQHDGNPSPSAGPQAKRPRLMNGHHPASKTEGASSTSQNPSGSSNSWNPPQNLMVSNLAGSSGPTPPSSISGT